MCGSPTKIFKSILWFKAEKLPNVLPADPSVQGTRCTRIKNSPQNTQNHFSIRKVSTKIIPKSFIESPNSIYSIQNVPKFAQEKVLGVPLTYFYHIFTWVCAGIIAFDPNGDRLVTDTCRQVERSGFCAGTEMT